MASTDQEPPISLERALSIGTELLRGRRPRGEIADSGLVQLGTTAAASYFLQTLPFARDGSTGRATANYMRGQPLQPGYANILTLIADSSRVPFG